MKSRWNMELIVSLSAIFIGVSAFFVSFYQAHQMSEQTKIFMEQQHASVWPRLFLSRRTGIQDEEFHYAVMLDNRGLGPAQIKYVEVLADGKLVQDWEQAYRELVGTELFTRNKAAMGNLIINPGESLPILRVSNEIAKTFYQHDLDIKACYCSLYDRCWILDEASVTKRFPLPVAVEQCPEGGEREFLD